MSSELEKQKTQHRELWQMAIQEFSSAGVWSEIQAGDIVRVTKYLQHRHDVDPDKVGALAIAGMCLPLIHAAAFDSSINNITLINSPISYRSIVMNRFYKIGLTKHGDGDYWHPYEVDFSWGIAGVLTGYDLPDLIGCIAPRKLTLANLQDHMLKSAPEALINEELSFPRAVYTSGNAASNLKVVTGNTDSHSLVDWSFSNQP